MNKYEQIKDILLDEYESDRLKHAYIFESSNIDKAIEMADFISKKIMDTDDLSRISDYKSIEKEDMNIATIRDIIKDCVIKPYKEKKIYVFKDCSKFTIPMQNAFLKTLEEPPQDVIFILITQNASSLLDTMRSRCIRYFFDEDVVDISEREDIVMITRRLFDIIIEKDKLKMIQYMEDIKKFKTDIDDILTSILENTRNIMLAKESIKLLPDEHKQNKYIHDIIGKFTYYELLTMIDLAEQARRKLNSNCNFNMTIETMLFKMMEVRV